LDFMKDGKKPENGNQDSLDLQVESVNQDNLIPVDFSTTEKKNSNLRIAFYSFFSTLFIIIVQLIRYYFFTELPEYSVTFATPIGIIVGDFIYIAALNRHSRRGRNIKKKELRDILSDLEKQEDKYLDSLTKDDIPDDLRKSTLQHLDNIRKQKLDITNKIVNSSAAMEWHLIK